MLAWLMNSEHGWITNCLRAVLYMPDLYPSHNGRLKHFSCFYRLFTRAKWDLDHLGQLMAKAFDEWLDETLYISIDDTLFRRGGPMILGGGVFHDPLRSNYTGRKKKAFSFGLNFVVVSVWVSMPWINPNGFSIPILFRMYRSKKTCEAKDYRTRTELAAQMLGVLRSWWPTQRFEVCVDTEYASQKVLRALDDNMVLTGPIGKNAKLFQPNRPVYSGKGRPPKWGKVIQKPRELAEDDSVPWQEMILEMYGHKVTLLVKTMQARRKNSGPDRVLTIVITRDPTGTYDDAYFVRTEANASPQAAITAICRRWTLEVTFRDCKQHLHIEQIQNGFVHRKEPTKTHRKMRPGPQAPIDADPKASRRTIPFFMFGYGFVVLWYGKHGEPERDLKWAKFLAPWRRDKTTISFKDMLQAFRRQMEHEDLWTNPPNQGLDEKYLRDLPFERIGQRDLEKMAA